MILNSICVSIIFLVSLICFSNTFSQLVLDNFQNHTITTTDVTHSSFSDNNIAVSRSIWTSRLSFHNSVGAPLNYTSSSAGIKEGVLEYKFFDTNLSEETVDFSLNSIFTFNFSNISNAFLGSVILTDINDDQKRLEPVHFLPSQSKYDFDFSTIGGVYGYFEDTKVKAFAVVFNIPDSNGDYANGLTVDLDSIEVVPEPFSLLTIASGIAAFIRKKRKNTCDS